MSKRNVVIMPASFSAILNSGEVVLMSTHPHPETGVVEVARFRATKPGSADHRRRVRRVEKKAAAGWRFGVMFPAE